MKTIMIIALVLFCAGCAVWKIQIGDATVELAYFLQNKDFKRLSYDPNTYTITIENFGSETSQVVESAISAGLGTVIK